MKVANSGIKDLILKEVKNKGTLPTLTRDNFETVGIDWEALGFKTQEEIDAEINKFN